MWSLLLIVLGSDLIATTPCPTYIITVNSGSERLARPFHDFLSPPLAKQLDQLLATVIGAPVARARAEESYGQHVCQRDTDAPLEA